MDTLLLYLTDTLPQRALMGLRFEGVRYVIGTLGVFFTIWILLAPFLQGRRIRKAMPRKRQISQIKTELFNSLRTICVFIARILLYLIWPKSVYSKPICRYQIMDGSGSPPPSLLV